MLSVELPLVCSSASGAEVCECEQSEVKPRY